MGDPVRAEPGLRRVRGGARAGRSRSSVRRTRWAATPFHFPPMHVACAEELRGGPGADPAWQLVRPPASSSSGRPARTTDRRPTFEPNSLLCEDAHGADRCAGAIGCLRGRYPETADDPWQLTTAPGSSSYTMHKDEVGRPAAARLPGRLDPSSPIC